jgi:glyoxylase-like metal-dependent hydrolase (beta-lactamase superfamily II)
VETVEVASGCSSCTRPSSIGSCSPRGTRSLSWTRDTRAITSCLPSRCCRSGARRPTSAVLLTHAHPDHLGSADALNRQHGVPVYIDEHELAHARREEHHGATQLDVLKNLWRPGVLSWLVAALRVGVTSKQGIASPASFPGGGGALDLPGQPVPVLTAGHTPGHTV